MNGANGSAIAKFVAVEIQKSTAPLLDRIERLEKALAATADKKPDTMQKLKSLLGA